MKCKKCNDNPKSDLCDCSYCFQCERLYYWCRCPTYTITLKSLDRCEKRRAYYQDIAEEYAKKAEESTGSRKGAYRANEVKARKDAKRWQNNLDAQIAWRRGKGLPIT